MLTKYVVIQGPDGSGKTAVADMLAQVLSAKGHQVHRINFSFGIMPSLSDMFGRRSRCAAPPGSRNGGMRTPLTRIRAAALAVWYGLDHILGHIALRRCKNGGVVISARSYHDFLYQLSYRRLPCWIPRCFIALGPAPDLVVAPLRDPHTIHAGKPELTIDEIRRQYGLITRRMQSYHYFVAVDASEGVNAVVDDICKRMRL